MRMSLKVINDPEKGIGECGECSECCKVFPLFAEQGIVKDSYVPCQHLAEHGCGIYEDRPSVCKDYLCLWRRVNKIHKPLYRPDILGVMFSVGTGSCGKVLEVWETWEGAFVENENTITNLLRLLQSIHSGIVAWYPYGSQAGISVHPDDTFDTWCARRMESLHWRPIRPGQAMLERSLA